MKARGTHGGVAKPHRSPPDVSTPSASRATGRLPKEMPGPFLVPDRVCFIPVTLMGFRLQGLDPPRDRTGVPPAPSFPAVASRAQATARLRRLDPSGERRPTSEEASQPALLALTPLRLSLPTPRPPASRRTPLMRFRTSVRWPAALQGVDSVGSVSRDAQARHGTGLSGVRHLCTRLGASSEECALSVRGSRRSRASRRRLAGR
jgi:hypothetical protein